MGNNDHYVNIICDPHDHTMNFALNKYIEDKIHPFLGLFSGQKVVVRGKYTRGEGSLNCNEKRDKKFNWKRPSAEFSEDRQTLFINCFPGQDYVYHYASLFSTYLQLIGRADVEVLVEPLNDKDCVEALLKTNITDVPKSDIIILGVVEKLHALTKHKPWSGNSDFSWSIARKNNKKIMLLGCGFSFWGDIAGKVVELLATKTKTIIYTGKLGGLKAHMQPNVTLATGNSSVVSGKETKWDNVFSGLVDKGIQHGKHYTLPSVLYEDKKWFNKVGYKYDFVDPEIGWMGRAAKEKGVNFSYMHIVSDNLARPRKENLSNERDTSIILKRAQITNNILHFLERGLTQL